jgi:hypothetical protein
VPPEAAYNNHRVVRAVQQQILSPERWDGKHGHIEQRGSGGYTLCDRCNNDTGAWYATEYVRWAQQALERLARIPVDEEGAVFIPFRGRPARFLKQVITMMFSANGPEFAALHPELVQFVLDRSATGLPPEYEVDLVLVRRGFARSAGGFGVVDLENGTMEVGSEIAHFPFASRLIHGGGRRARRGALEPFAQLGPDEQREVWLYTIRVVVGASHPEAFVRELSEWLAAPRRDEVRLERSRPPARPSASAPMSREVLARFGNIETRSPAFARVLEHAAQVASSNLSVLLLGESGTGKEHLARAIHEASPRARGPFVAVNCAALADSLIESELFGHKKGAFTGALDARPGAFVSARGGTLLLDEIGDAPLRVQLALLRALEAKTIRAVGSDVDQAVDVRVIGATSRDVRELIERQVFREDLFYRLAELTLELPPLRARREDIPGLAVQILRALGESVTVSQQAEAELVQHAWPGNVRELRNALKAAVAMSQGSATLQATHFARVGVGEGMSGDGSAEFDGGGARYSATGAAVLTFPVHVVRYADEIWREGALPDEAPGNRHDQRALNRAALICLASRGPLTAWPSALTREWHRLFGERWATAEEGRGVRAVMRQLGLDPKSASEQERVLGVLRAVGSR